jgi:hypothetical protein
MKEYSKNNIKSVVFNQINPKFCVWTHVVFLFIFSFFRVEHYAVQEFKSSKTLPVLKSITSFAHERVFTEGILQETVDRQRRCVASGTGSGERRDGKLVSILDSFYAVEAKLMLIKSAFLPFIKAQDC